MKKTYRKLSAFIAVFVLLTTAACITGCTKASSREPDELQGTFWCGDDGDNEFVGTYLSFEEGGKVRWYLTVENLANPSGNKQKNRQTSGVYTLTRGEAAKKLIVENYSNLGLTADTVDEMCSDSPFEGWTIENLCVISFKFDGSIKKQIHIGFIEDSDNMFLINVADSTYCAWSKM